MQVGVDDVAHAAVQLVGVEGDELRRAGGVHAGHRRLTRRGVALGRVATPPPTPPAGRRTSAMCMLATRCCAAWNDAIGPTELLAHHRVVDGPLQCRLADPDEVEATAARRGVGQPAQLARPRTSTRSRGPRTSSNRRRADAA